VRTLRCAEHVSRIACKHTQQFVVHRNEGLHECMCAHVYRSNVHMQLHKHSQVPPSRAKLQNTCVCIASYVQRDPVQSYHVMPVLLEFGPEALRSLFGVGVRIRSMALPS
jgi:hypothetical protein